MKIRYWYLILSLLSLLPSALGHCFQTMYNMSLHSTKSTVLRSNLQCIQCSRAIKRVCGRIRKIEPHYFQDKRVDCQSNVNNRLQNIQSRNDDGYVRIMALTEIEYVSLEAIIRRIETRELFRSSLCAHVPVRAT